MELAQLAGDGDYLYRCNYVVWAKVEGIEDKVKANLKFTRQDSWWDGNELAQALNNDTDLRDSFNRMKKGWRLWFPVVEIKPFKRKKGYYFALRDKALQKHQGIKITPKGDYYSPEAAFPSIEALEAFDRIAYYIRGIINNHP